MCGETQNLNFNVIGVLKIVRLYCFIGGGGGGVCGLMWLFGVTSKLDY